MAGSTYQPSTPWGGRAGAATFWKFMNNNTGDGGTKGGLVEIKFFMQFGISR